ncbi:hypothetical protein Clacol_004991 [Clathrus columnatus]|uniref:Uncharacterized protein n=1 Tax=Clathrus columnatus TaxID=1419009 RepID=A0AAV5AC88_9AGAM|nr:hypothetical protein Clacol_004991 [Clathrus columnatus]
MRLPFDADIDISVDHSYQGPYTLALLWSYELLGKALRQMINLKAFEWLYPESLLFDVNSDVIQPFSNQGSSPKQIEGLGLVTAADTFDSGKSVISFIRTCHELKYLKLQTNDQALVGDLMSLCRWPKLQVLNLDIADDPSEPPTEECIRDFIAYHSSLVSLTWYISLHMNDLPLPILSFNSLPHLVAVDGSADDIWPIILSPCTPPRPLEKITRFPTAAEFWSRPERSFQSISKSSLRIVAIAVKQVSQLTELAAHFPNIECINLTGSEIYQQSITWDDEAPDAVKKALTSLSSFTNLRVILGFRFWDYREPEEMRETPRRREYFRWVHTLLPRLEFCSVGFRDGIEFIREGNDVSWKWFGLPSSSGEYARSNRERDFTIREERDQFAS